MAVATLWTLTPFDYLMLGSALCWSVTYGLILRRGFIDKTYGMPVAALAANLSWEAIYTLNPQTAVQGAVNGVWLLLDVGILAQFVWYGPRELPGWSRPKLLVGFACAAVVASSLIWFVGVDLGDEPYGIYAAFGQNLLMSLLFLQMLHLRRRLPQTDPSTGRPVEHPRGGLRGQSVWIALFKGLGTLFASAAFAWGVVDDPSKHIATSHLLPLLYGLILVADVAYIIETWRRGRPTRYNAPA